ncbi:MAG: hypothetical protein P8X63_08575, partial [Desulfuromonadaceae bacterium]
LVAVGDLKQIAAAQVNQQSGRNRPQQRPGGGIAEKENPAPLMARSSRGAALKKGDEKNFVGDGKVLDIALGILLKVPRIRL